MKKYTENAGTSYGRSLTYEYPVLVCDKMGHELLTLQLQHNFHKQRSFCLLGIVYYGIKTRRRMGKDLTWRELKPYILPDRLLYLDSHVL
jgi:hypothetical protein